MHTADELNYTICNPKSICRAKLGKDEEEKQKNDGQDRYNETER